MKINVFVFFQEVLRNIGQIKFAPTRAKSADAYCGMNNIGRIEFAPTRAKSADANCEKSEVFKLYITDFIYVLKRSFTALVLICCLFLYFSVNFIACAVAAPSQIVESINTGGQSDRLPPKIVKAVIADLTKQQNLLPEKLKVTKYSRESWSDGCLELPQPEEICSQAIVEGWRVVVSDGSQKWVYRSDARGKNVRLETPNSKVKI